MEARTGYGGGYNERGVVEYRRRESSSDDEFDEFGRRKKKRRPEDDKVCINTFVYFKLLSFQTFFLFLTLNIKAFDNIFYQ